MSAVCISNSALKCW